MRLFLDLILCAALNAILYSKILLIIIGAGGEGALIVKISACPSKQNALKIKFKID